MTFFSRIVLFVFIVVLGAQVTAQDDLDTLKAEAIATHAEIVHASYADSLELAVELNEALMAFVENPTEETLQAAKDAWLAANEPYGQTEAYRFYGGPIDDEDGPEALMNAWPLDEVYIDYVEGNPDSGIINDPETYPEITADLLIELNEAGGEENISTGFHAIEFLLWGQDLSADSAGQRPYTDYTTAPNADRRGQYLLVVGDLLVQHLTEVVDAWAPDVEDNFRAEFLAMPVDEALTDIFTGIGVLAKSELAGERMFTAYDNQDQEDEHSCFSDNTHRDIITNFIGIRNVYLGEYTRIDGTVVSGTGLNDVVAAVDEELNEEMVDLLQQIDIATQQIAVPFDQAIVQPESRPQVFDTVMLLLDFGDKIAESAAALGLVIDTSLPA